MQQQTMLLRTDALYKFLTGTSDKIDTLIMCQSNNLNLITYDQCLYEALGSIKDKSKINHHKLVKLLEVVNIYSFKEKVGGRTILKHKRVEEIRNSIKGDKNV